MYRGEVLNKLKGFNMKMVSFRVFSKVTGGGNLLRRRPGVQSMLRASGIRSRWLVVG